MEDREYDTLKFLSTQNKPIHLDNFPNEIKAQYPEPYSGDRIDLQFNRILVKGKQWLEQNPTNGGYTITEHGKKALVKEESVRLEQGEQRNLEMQKLRTEVALITSQLLDYDKVKSRTIRSEWIAIFAAVVAAIGLVIQWLCNKPG